MEEKKEKMEARMEPYRNLLGCYDKVCYVGSITTVDQQVGCLSLRKIMNSGE